MKRFCLILLIAGGMAAVAQANAPDERIHIHSDTGFFDMNKHRVIYQGQVRVDHPEMALTCEWLAADLPHDKNPNRHIVATNQVVINFIDDKGTTNHTTSDSAIYDFTLKDSVTNEMVTLSGHAVLTNQDFTVTGEPLVLNLLTRQFSATNQVVTINSSALHLNSTNSAKTNRLSAPK